jgi:hypothetical protein
MRNEDVFTNISGFTGFIFELEPVSKIRLEFRAMREAVRRRQGYGGTSEKAQDTRWF